MKRLFLLVLFLITVKDVMAVDGGVYFLAPPFSDISINKNEPEKNFELEIGNRSNSISTFELSVVDFGTLDDSGGVAFLTNSSKESVRKYSLASWISLEKNFVILAPGKSEKIKVSILNKKSLTDGGHYGAILATLRNDEDVEKDSLGFRQTLASLIYVLKNGSEKIDLKINKLEFNKSQWELIKKIKIRFENNGSTHVIPRGKLELIDWKGKITGKGIINESSAIILPESFRMMDVSINVFEGWHWPGKYTLNIYFRPDSKTEFQNQKIRLVYFGKEGALLTMASVLIVSLIFWSLIRKNSAKNDEMV